MIYTPDQTGSSSGGIMQVSARDARDLATVLCVLGHLDLAKAIRLTAHEAEAFSQF